MRISYRCVWAFLLSLFLLFSSSHVISARDTRDEYKPVRSSGAERTERSRSPGSGPLYMPAEVDTYVVAEYDFDSGDQGWTGADITQQEGVFFHVDDFSGLTTYAPLEGSQSLWCGTRPSTVNPFCRYQTLPGYGNGWYQWFESDTFLSGHLTFTYWTTYDIEPNYDAFYVQIDTAGVWEDLPVNGGSGVYSGAAGPIEESFTVYPPDSTARFRFLFISDHVYSDEDGYYQSQTGAALIDSISVINTIDYLLASTGSYNTSGTASGVYIDGGYAYIADGDAGLHIVDISSPETPSWVATVNTPGTAYDVVVDNGYAYIADGPSGITIVDVTTPSSPSAPWSLGLGSSGMAVEVVGDYAYVAASAAGLKVVYIANPLTPTVFGTCDTAGLAMGLVISYSLAYVADYENGLLLINIGAPSSPSIFSTCHTSGEARDVALSGDIAYVAGGSAGMTVVDLEQIWAPTVIATHTTPDTAHGIAVFGDRAYVAAGSAGLIAFDITSPASPQLEGGNDTPGTAFDVAVSGSYAYVADGSAGLRVIEEIIDEIETLDSETFEDEDVGDTVADRWTAYARPAYGDYAGRFNGSSVVQEDECSENDLWFWGFFNGSTDDYSCGGHAGQAVVPHGNSDGVYMRNEIWSPWIDLDAGGTIPASATGMLLEFMVYRDLPLDNLVFYTWKIRAKSGESGCHGRWMNRSFIYWGEEKEWITESFEVGDLIETGTTHVQIALSCYDMEGAWDGIFGTGDCHSHAPLFDNVKLKRMDAGGPIWSVYHQDLFQDNFPGDGTTSGFVRMDAARNVCRSDCACSSGDYLALDCLKVKVWEPNVGLATDWWSNSAAVHCYVKSTGGYTNIQMQSKDSRPGKAVRFFRSLDSPTLGGFHKFAMDTLFYADFNSCGSSYIYPYSNEFCFDLHDSLFVPGDTIFFYFGATDNNSNTSYWSEFTGVVHDQSVVEAAPMEMMCLPGGGYANGGDILYVDNCDNEDTQQYFDSAFELLGIADKVDRFDIRGTMEASENGLETHVANLSNQLQDCYRKIIWSSGTLESGTIGDGEGSPGKVSDDAGLLYQFLYTYPPGAFAGIYLVGDNIAEEMNTLAGPGIALLSNYIRYDLISGDHRAFGMPWRPLLCGTGEPFYNGGNPDSLLAVTACPGFRNFDVIGPTGSNKGLQYDGFTDHCGLVTLTGLSSFPYPVYTVLQSFGFSAVRDDKPGFPPDRVRLLERVIEFLGNSLPDPTGGDATPIYQNALVQNYPNPFNPATTVPFSLRERSRVAIRVYNVAGQLVRVLVDEERDAGIYTDVTWNGRDTAGNLAASGVYFCKMQVNDYVKTRKMVLLK